MRLLYLSILFLVLSYSQTAVPVFAFTLSPTDYCIITSLLQVGSKGIEVQCLQSKVGVVQDGSFGPQTKAAVVAFQSSHMLTPDGIVGPLSRAVLGNIVMNSAVYPPGCTGTSKFSATTGMACTSTPSFPAGCTSTMGYSPTTGVKCNSSPISNNTPPVTQVPVPAVNLPKILSVSPEKVRSGDTVKVTGENFTPTGNTIRLGYGQIEASFSNLSSTDGKTISFVYQPPDVKTMSKEELLNLPPAILNKILDPAKAIGGTIDDIVEPYRNLKDENDLRQLLSNNGQSFDQMYDKFYVMIDNANGKASSKTAILSGLRKLVFGSNLATLLRARFSSTIDSFTSIFTPKIANAQLPEGGYNSGIITQCTCGPGYLTYITDYSTNGGSGLYWWFDGFPVIVGDPRMSGPHLGFFIQNAGECVMESGPSCFTITANMASLPWGEAPY